MVDSRPSDTGEISAVIDDKSERGIFSRKKPNQPQTADLDKVEEKNDKNATEVKPAEREILPVSFTQLFRCVFSL